MKLLTLKSGSDFEQTSNTGFTEAAADAGTSLYFSKKAYINQYTKKEKLFTWDGSKFRMKKTQIYHKSSFIDMKYDLEFDLKIEDAFKVEISTNLISVHIMTTSPIFKYQSLSFVIDGEIKNFYYAGTVVTEYAGVKEFHITKEKSIDFHKSVGSEKMYITLTYNLMRSFSTISVLWMNYVDPNMKMIVDFDAEVIPQIKYGGESYIVPKRKAKHLLNINYHEEYYQIAESFYNINLTYGFRFYSNWKTLVFVINEHFPDSNQISVDNLSLELRTVGNVINAIKRGNENILSLGSIYIYDIDLAIHYENHPWFPGFHNYAAYNYTGELKLVGDSPNPEFIEWNQYDEDNPSNTDNNFVPDDSVPATDDTNDGDSVPGDEDGDSVPDEEDPTDTVTVGDGDGTGEDGEDGEGDGTGDGNTENASQNILPSTYPNGDIVINNISFPWELLMVLYDYDDYTFDTQLSFDDHYWHYAILDQMKIIDGNYEIIKAGKVNMGNYIVMPIEPIEYPIILFSKYRGYFDSTGNRRLTQMSEPENAPTSVINVDILSNYFALNIVNTTIDVSQRRGAMGWIYPDGSIYYVIERSTEINLESHKSLAIENVKQTDILYHNEIYDRIEAAELLAVETNVNSETTLVFSEYINLDQYLMGEINVTNNSELLLTHNVGQIIYDIYNTTIQLQNTVTETE